MTCWVVQFVSDTDSFTNNFSIFYNNRTGRKTALCNRFFCFHYCLLEKLFVVHICILAFFLCVAQKNQSEDGAGFLPPTPSSRVRPSTAFRPATLPEYLEGRTPKEKHPFLFQKKFHPRQIRNARSVFSFL